MDLGELFRPGAFTGDLTLFVADDNPASIEETAEKWAKVVEGNVSVSGLPDRHVDLLDVRFAPAIARTVNRTALSARWDGRGTATDPSRHGRLVVAVELGRPRPGRCPPARSAGRLARCRTQHP